jgi:hypothetical protein
MRIAPPVAHAERYRSTRPEFGLTLRLPVTRG